MGCGAVSNLPSAFHLTFHSDRARCIEPGSFLPIIPVFAGDETVVGIVADKGLRDAKFDDGLSSICIMALVVRSVEQLGRLDPNRFDLALVDVAREIARNLQQPVANPAFPDDASKHLCGGWDTNYRAKVRTLFAEAADQLEEGIDGTFHRTIAVQKARAAYGARVPNEEALVSADSAASIVRSVEPQPQPKPVVPRTKSG